jgi:hypothetical protein
MPWRGQKIRFSYTLVRAKRVKMARVCMEILLCITYALARSGPRRARYRRRWNASGRSLVRAKSVEMAYRGRDSQNSAWLGLQHFWRVFRVESSLLEDRVVKNEISTSDLAWTGPRRGITGRRFEPCS